MQQKFNLLVKKLVKINLVKTTKTNIYLKKQALNGNKTGLYPKNQFDFK
jgi:hypothetical protein